MNAMTSGEVKNQKEYSTIKTRGEYYVEIFIEDVIVELDHSNVVSCRIFLSSSRSKMIKLNTKPDKFFEHRAANTMQYIHAYPSGLIAVRTN